MKSFLTKNSALFFSIMLFFIISLKYAYSLDYNDTFLMFQNALYHKEKAVEMLNEKTQSLTKDGQKELYIARDILLNIVKKNPSKEIYYTLAEVYDIDKDIFSAINAYETIIDKYNYDKTSLLEIGKRYFFLASAYNGRADKENYNEYANKAIISFKKILDEEPHDKDAAFYLGYISFSLNDFLSAVKYLTPLSENIEIENPYSVYAKYYIGVSSFFMGKFRNAVDNLSFVSPSDINHDEALYYYTALLKSKQALEDYKGAYETAKDGYARLKIYDVDVSVLIFLSYISGDFDKELYEKTVASARELPPVINIIGQAIEEGKIKAIETIEKNIDRNTVDLDMMQMYVFLINDKSVSASKEDIIEAKKSLVSFYEKIGNYDSIYENHAETIVSYDKKYEDIYLFLSEEFLKNGEEKRSLITLKKYLQSGVEKSRGNIEKSLKIALYLKDYNTVISMYNILYDMEKENYAYKYRIAFYYSALSDKDKSILALKEADKLFTENKKEYEKKYGKAYTKESLHIAAGASLIIRDKELSMKYFNELIKLYPKDKDIINGIAWTLIELDIDIKQGIEYAKKAVALDLENSYYIDTLGWGYFKEGDFAKAEKLFLEAIEKSDSEYAACMSYYHLADTYYMLDNMKESLKYYEKAYRFREQTLELDEEYILKKIDELKVYSKGK